MSQTVEATYEDGVLKPAEPVALAEHEQVRITIHPARSIAEETAGMIPWHGDPDLLEWIAYDPEFGILESP